MFMLYNKLQLKGCQTQLIIEVYKQLIKLRTTSFGYLYVVGSKSFRPDIQKPRQMANAVRDT